MNQGEIEQLLEKHGLPLSSRRLRQLADEGFLPKPQAGVWSPLETIAGIARFYRARLKSGGDLAGERLRKTREEADKLALENEKTRGNLVEVEAVYKHFEGYFIALRARILASGLADDEKDELLNDLRKIKARDVAKPR